MCVCTIYEINETDDGQLYLVMAHYEGETLKERIERGPLPIEEALDIAIQMAKGLSKAHAAKIIHRDIKPANVIITADGLVKIVDFGIAKLLGVTGPTQTGTTVGTVAYMSPEQLAGKEADERADVWSLGAVLYEMLTGQQPFRGDNEWAIVGNISGREPAAPRSLRTEIPADVEAVVVRALEKSRQKRYPTAEEFLSATKACHAELTRPDPVPLASISPWRRLATAKVALPVLLVALLVAVSAIWSAGRTADTKRVEEEVITEIERLVEEDRYVEAFRIAEEVEGFSTQAPELLAELWLQISLDASIETDPPGAEVLFRDYATPDSDWQSLGQTPIVNRRLPLGLFVWSIRLDGYNERTLAIANPQPFLGNDLFEPPRTIVLDEVGSVPPGMVRVGAANIGMRLTGFNIHAPIASPSYTIDRFEVTNKEFKTFVDHGGYQTPEFWKEVFVRDGRTLSWDEAIAEFLDATGRPGPSTWQVGNFPEGETDFPVTGVSWYEAAAYAEFVGKVLPTVYHMGLGGGDREGHRDCATQQHRWLCTRSGRAVCGDWSLWDVRYGRKRERMGLKQIGIWREPLHTRRCMERARVHLCVSRCPLTVRSVRNERLPIIPIPRPSS